MLLYGVHHLYKSPPKSKKPTTGPSSNSPAVDQLMNDLNMMNQQTDYNNNNHTQRKVHVLVEIIPPASSNASTAQDASNMYGYRIHILINGFTMCEYLKAITTDLGKKKNLISGVPIESLTFALDMYATTENNSIHSKNITLWRKDNPLNPSRILSTKKFNTLYTTNAMYSMCDPIFFQSRRYKSNIEDDMDLPVFPDRSKVFDIPLIIINPEILFMFELPIQHTKTYAMHINASSNILPMLMKTALPPIETVETADCMYALKQSYENSLKYVKMMKNQKSTSTVNEHFMNAKLIAMTQFNSLIYSSANDTSLAVSDCLRAMSKYV